MFHILNSVFGWSVKMQRFKLIDNFKTLNQVNKILKS